MNCLIAVDIHSALLLASILGGAIICLSFLRRDGVRDAS